MEVGFSPGDLVLDGDPPSPKRGRTPPQLSAHFYCGQTAGCIQMPLGIEVGFGPGDFVVDGQPATSQKEGVVPQIFGPCLSWPNGWMDQDGTLYGDFVLDGDQAPLPKKGGAPNFRPSFIVAERLHGTRMYGDGPRPTRHCVRWGTSSPSPKGAQPPIFGQCPLWPNGWMD